MRKSVVFLLVVLILPLYSCATYRSQEVPFQHPTAFSEMRTAAGAQIAAQDYADSSEARAAFGFDIRRVGILPVQVVVDNAGEHPLMIVPEQSFLIDEEGNMWNVLERRTAYERIEKSTEFGRVAGTAGRRSVLGGAGGALVGAAIGVLTGDNVGTAATRGAAVGAAGGAVLGGAEELSSPEAGRQISRDLANKELENRLIEPGVLAQGFLFFPGEAPSARELRLQVREQDTGRLHTLMFPLK
jgi:hypothetical protein